MPREPVRAIGAEYSRGGKIIHRADALDIRTTRSSSGTSRSSGGSTTTTAWPPTSARGENDASSGSWRPRWSRHSRTSTVQVTQIIKSHKVEIPGLPYLLRVAVERPGKAPLVAQFGGLSFTRKKTGFEGTVDFEFECSGGVTPAEDRRRFNACWLRDVSSAEGGAPPGPPHPQARRPQPEGTPPIQGWKQAMIARKRKTLMVCHGCHIDITAGRHDGPRCHVHRRAVCGESRKHGSEGGGWKRPSGPRRPPTLPHRRQGGGLLPPGTAALRRRRAELAVPVGAARQSGVLARRRSRTLDAALSGAWRVR